MRSATWTCRRWDARSEPPFHSDTAPRPSRYCRSTADLLEGAHGRFLFGVSPTASDSRGPHRELGDQALDLEILAVRRPVSRHYGVLRQGDPPRLKQLLQKGFRVFAERLRIQRGEQRLIQAPNGFAGRRKTPVDKDRSDQSFERIGQNRGPREPAALQLAFAQLQVIAHAEGLRHLIQGLLAHQLRAQPRQLSLGKLGEALEQLGRDDAVENAVAQELQALVVKRAVAAVRECPRQELGAGKTVSDMLLKTLPVHGSRRRAGRACDGTRPRCVVNYCCSQQNRTRR